MNLYDKIKDRLQPNWHTKKTIKALKYGNIETAIAFFCPSYRKNGFGFNRQIGNTTKQGIHFVSNLPVKNKILVFCDLLLENYKKLTMKDMEDLLACYRNFLRYVNKKSVHSKRLSDFERLKFGYKGLMGEIPEKKKKGLLDRERMFYSRLGWADKKILQRLNILAGSYKEMGKLVERKNAALVMIENQYERGCLYGNIPIIYPKKQLMPFDNINPKCG